MGMLSDLMYQRKDGYEPDPRQRVAEQMLLAQNSIPAGMQKHYIDQKLFGPAEQPPAEQQGHTFKGQVGTTVMPPDQEAQLRGMLRARGLSAAQIDAMVAAHKAAKGLR